MAEVPSAATLEARVEKVNDTINNRKPEVVGSGVRKGAGKEGDSVPVVENMLQQADGELCKRLISVMGSRRVDALVAPHAQRLCVTLFSAETCAFVWDLCLLAGWRQLPAVLTSVLIHLKAGLSACTDALSASAFLQSSATQITPAQLQRVLEDHFMGEIRKELHAPQPNTVLE